jgi:hypothetical protein
VLSFVISSLLMTWVLYQENIPLEPQGALQSDLRDLANALFLPAGLSLLIFGLTTFGILIMFLSAQWGEQAVKRGLKMSALITGYGCSLVFIAGMLLALYGAFRFSPPQNALEWLIAVLFASVLGAAIFALLRPAFRWWRSFSKRKADRE